MARLGIHGRWNARRESWNGRSSRSIVAGGRIAEGVRHGHRHGVAHLDIKPANILLRGTGSGTWDYPKVSDWGLAKLLLEHSNSVEGISPTYAAPEQFDSDEFGAPDDITDIYQLGTVVYALVAGEPPFTGSSTAVMRSVLDDKPRPPSEHNPDVPESVDEIVLKALAKNKADRYESVILFRKELDRLFGSYAIEDSGPGQPSGVTPANKPTTAEAADTVTEENEATPRSTASASRAEQHGSVSDGKGRRSPARSTVSDPSDDDSPSIMTRRRAIGILGLGAFGTGGWVVTTRSQDNGSRTAAVPTADSTSTGSESETAPATENTETARPSAETRASLSGTHVDDFEGGEFADAWRNGIDTSNYRSGTDGGRRAFSVQSVPSSHSGYALQGDRDLAGDGTSSILRDDFAITQDGASIQLIVKLGQVIDGSERANQIEFIELADDVERGYNPLIMLDQKDRPRSAGARIGNGNTANSVMESLRRVELIGIDFSNNRVAEVRVGGETVGTELDFLNEGSEVSAIRIKQGHYGQPSDILVDAIAVQNS